MDCLTSGVALSDWPWGIGFAVSSADVTVGAVGAICCISFDCHFCAAGLPPAC